jgi:hypothetical protein
VTVENQSIGGIWSAQVTEDDNSTATVWMLSTAAGQFFAYGVDELFYTGSLTVSGSTVSGTEQGAIFSAGGCVTMNVCAVKWTETVSGTVAQGATLNLSGTTGTPDSTLNYTYNWTFSSLYNYSSSLAQIAGSWTGWNATPNETSPDVLTLTSGGAISLQNQAATCMVSGQVSLIDPQHNAYSLTVSWTGSGCELPGATGQGIAYLDYTQSPTVLQMMINYAVPGQAQTYILAVTAKN